MIKEYMSLYFILFIISVSFCDNNYKAYEIKADIRESGLEIMNYENNKTDICQKWILSLFSPLMLLPQNENTEDIEIFDESLEIKIPILSDRPFPINIFKSSRNELFGYYDVLYAKTKFWHIIDNCFVGLSCGNGNYDSLEENVTLLNQLYKTYQINKKVFSFERWEINAKDNSIKSTFYIGSEHYHFLSNKEQGIIGSCQNEYNYLSPSSSSYWGCYFDYLSINDIYASLKMDELNYYRIVFAAETYDIFLPYSFQNNFYNLTNNKCKEERYESYLYCDNFFGEESYQTIKLIRYNMNITIEIDSADRFLRNFDDKHNKTRIRFFEGDYFIFPLIMFKNFHVQFDAENELIKFYTTNENILSLRKEEKK